MTDKSGKTKYENGFRIWVGTWALLAILNIPYVVYLELTLPFNHYILLGLMIISSLFLVYVLGYMAITGYKPGFLLSGSDKTSSNNPD